MSLFNKIFSSIGIGSAKVDTKLYQEKFEAGHEVTGIVEVIGGNTEQKIDEIYLSLLTTYVKESNDRKFNQQATIEKIRIVESFTIGVDERKEIPFSLKLPYDTPITMGKTKVWIQTGLDIKNALDPSDKDYIGIAPSPIISSILNAVYDLGFSLRKVDCEVAPYKFRSRLPFIQEFEFVPTNGAFRGKLDEVELVFFQKSSDTVEVIMEVDRRARGLAGLFSEALEMDESIIRFTVTSRDIPNIKQQLSNTIHSYC
ncbi:sporulation protein [Ferdinandcohnia quinoae]|uniref:Sporulation protein n=1 Tax=Fredinandcohnia quinoae TaxID=2918902 RepID=A0AAW5E0A6_9BACI|nr:sporulation protein [Fredinandcohnia sp. SECRCQ15]MCH1626341.1 sporulation protein [Fredinandcohnia sp. SECRCQ15]